MLIGFHNKGELVWKKRTWRSPRT